MKKLFNLILSIVLCLCFLLPLTACSDKSLGGNSIINPRTETIKVGYIDYAPLNYTYQGKFTGYNTKLAVSIFEALGYEVKFVLVEPTDEERRIVNSDDVYEALRIGKIDCFFGAITDAVLNDDTKFDFSYRYLENSPCLVISNGSEYINSAQDFEDRTVAFGTFSSGEDYFNSFLANIPNVNFVNCEKGQASALHKTNSILEPASCAIVDTIYAYYHTEKTNEYNRLALNDKNNPDAYKLEQKNYLRVVFKKSDNGTNELRDRVNLTFELFANIINTIDDQNYSLLQSLALGDSFSIKDLVDFVTTDFSDQK